MKDEEHKQLRLRVEQADICKRRIGYLKDLSIQAGFARAKALYIRFDKVLLIEYAEASENVKVTGTMSITGVSEFAGLGRDIQTAILGVIDKYLATERAELEKI